MIVSELTFNTVVVVFILLGINWFLIALLALYKKTISEMNVNPKKYERTNDIKIDFDIINPINLTYLFDSMESPTVTNYQLLDLLKRRIQRGSKFLKISFLMILFLIFFLVFQLFN